MMARGASFSSRKARCVILVSSFSISFSPRSRDSMSTTPFYLSSFYSYVLIKMLGCLMVRVFLSRAYVMHLCELLQSAAIERPARVKSMFAISFSGWFTRRNIMTAVYRICDESICSRNRAVTRSACRAYQSRLNVTGLYWSHGATKQLLIAASFL